MNTIVPSTDNIASLLERVLIEGDLSKLTPSERMSYYSEVCRSAGLNPLTKPFAYLNLNNKLQLYALKACTDQLRFVHKISVESIENKTVAEVYVVTAKVKNVDGRTDVDDGAVNISGLKGEALANAFMKATTKAKRRATLSLCGLGILDESEVDSIPGAQKFHEATVSATTPTPPPAPKVTQKAQEPVSADGAHPIPVPVDGGKEQWMSWGKTIIAAIMACTAYEEVDAWRIANDKILARCEMAAPKAYGSIHKAISKKADELVAAQPVPEPERTISTPASEVGADEAYADWIKDVQAELDQCMNQEAVEEIRARIMPEMKPEDVPGWKEACLDKANTLFVAASDAKKRK